MHHTMIWILHLKVGSKLPQQKGKGIRKSTAPIGSVGCSKQYVCYWYWSVMSTCHMLACWRDEDTYYCLVWSWILLLYARGCHKVSSSDFFHKFSLVDSMNWFVLKFPLLETILSLTSPPFSGSLNIARRVLHEKKRLAPLSSKPRHFCHINSANAF